MVNAFVTISDPLIATPPCFARGTLIGTATGETPVEQLAIGDGVMTASGALRRVKWIGHRSYSGRFAAGNPDILPVLVRAGVLADGVPHTDLLVSPKHALFLDGLLIPAGKLSDGAAIRQLSDVEAIEYWHVELDSHDILLANGAPAESFVDVESRNLFHNAGEFEALYPEAVSGAPMLCAPLVDSGERLAAVRARLAMRSGAMPRRSAPGVLAGHIEHADLRRIRGWASNSSQPGEPVQLVILDGEAVIAEAYADLPRPDLIAAGLGACAFDVALPQLLSPLTPHDIAVRRVDDGALLGAIWSMDPLVAVA